MSFERVDGEYRLDAVGKQGLVDRTFSWPVARNRSATRWNGSTTREIGPCVTNGIPAGGGAVTTVTNGIPTRSGPELRP